MAEVLHGGNIYEAAIQSGRAIKDIVDFSANINPLGIPAGMRRILIEGLDELVDYPDPDCTDLRKELSTYLNTPMERILAGNGASEIIRLVFETLKPKKLFMPGPCFSEYEAAAKICGTAVEYHELSEADEFSLDVVKFIAAVPEDTDAIIVCNPNNPTSKLIPKTGMEKLAGYCHGKGISLIADEAFIELTEGGNLNSVVCLLEQHPGMVIVRSATKLFAVPGLRLGYAAGNPEMIKKMKDMKMQWSVNSLACSIGRVFNEETEYFARTAAWLSEEKTLLYEELVKIEWLKVFKPDTNFILVRLKPQELTSSILCRELLSKGIMIRDASNFRFLNDKFIRVAVKGREDNMRLVSCLRDYYIK